MDRATTQQSVQLAGALAKSRTLHGIVIVTTLALLAGGSFLLAGPAMLSVLVASQQITRQQHAASSSCVTGLEIAGTTTTSVSVGSLTREQVALAHTIWRVAREVGVGDRGAVIGIATAAQESTLGANPATRRLNRDGDVAAFQQRAYLGWYAPGTTVADNTRHLLDPVTGARTFFLGHTVTPDAHAAALAAGTQPAGPVGYHIPGLVNIANWEQLPVTVAAQRVQRSAFPDAYAKHEPLAATLVQRFTAEAGTTPTEPNPQAAAAALAAGNAGLCNNGNTDAASCPDSGLAVERNLTPDAVRVLRCVKAQFPELRSFGGVGDRPANVDDDHQTGRAVDIMIPGRCDPLGDRVREYLYDNQRQLGVKYLIWCDRIWSVARNREGWRPYSNPNGGNDTLAHRDHVHVSVFGNAAGDQVGAPGQPSGTTVTPLGSYRLTARFGQCSRLWRACHTGLDFGAPAGAPIRAVTDGTVTSTAWGGAYGNLTKLDHGGGLETWYAHQTRQSVTVGDRVTAGQQIGTVGETGNAFGAHLHLEVRRGGTPIDPDSWLRSRGVRP